MSAPTGQQYNGYQSQELMQCPEPHPEELLLHVEAIEKVTNTESWNRAAFCIQRDSAPLECAISDFMSWSQQISVIPWCSQVFIIKVIITSQHLSPSSALLPDKSHPARHQVMVQVPGPLPPAQERPRLSLQILASTCPSTGHCQHVKCESAHRKSMSLNSKYIL